MGLFGSRKPEWRHKDPAVRLASISSIDPGATELLAELGRDPDRGVRRAAINRLPDLAALARLGKDADPEDLPIIIARQDDLRAARLLAEPAPADWRDELARITSPQLLAQLAAQAPQPEMRLAAVDRIVDPELLVSVLRQNCGKQPALAALAKISDPVLLTDLAESAASKTARREATQKLAEIDRLAHPVSDGEIAARKLEALAAEAARVVEADIIDAAALKLAAIRAEWHCLDPGRNHPAAAALREICADFDARYQEILAYRKNGQEKAAKYEQFQARLQELCALVERLSCSAADDAPAAKERATAEWTSLLHDSEGAMAPSPALSKRFADACRAFEANRPQIELEKERSQAVARQCAEIRERIVGHDLKKARTMLAETAKRLARLKFKYGSATILERQVAEARAELELAEKEVRDRNLARREEICTALEQLTGSDNPQQIEKLLHAQKLAWQELARLEDPAGRALEERYLGIVAALNEQCTTLAHEQDWELWANLTRKEDLLARVAALDGAENLESVVGAIKEAQAAWKEIGPVPPRESQRIWNAFQDACHRNYERARPFLEEQKAAKVLAMDRRREICTLAAELAESSEWQKTALALKEMQEEWKNLPHGTRRDERQLYQQFRGSCNRFFARRQEHHESLDRERGGNLLAKERLCEEAEQLAASPEIDHPRRFKQLQAQWQKIGPAPRQKEGGVWQRFRAACDAYFHWLTEEQLRNLQRKEDLCGAAEKLLADAVAGGNQKEIAAGLTALQQQWKEIGPTPPERSEEVWQRFRAACDQFFTARQQEYARDEEERRANQSQKEELLARALELASGRDKETAVQLQLLQKEWFAVGPAPRAINKELNDRFKALCDAFFEDRRQFFSDLKTQQLENQRQKESLCLRLENLLGLSYPAGGQVKGKALSLAEELKQAMENNFMLAGRRDGKKEISDEIRRIQQEWDKIGPVPPAQTRPLAERYQKALGAYHASRRPQEPGAKSERA